jgi:amidase
MDILGQDATGQLSALASGQISACELLQVCLDRVDSIGHALNAVIVRDLDRAFAAARRGDDLRARGDALGRLAGLPMTVKDVYDMEGLPASAGLKIPLDLSAGDAEVVARVRREDAVIWGKTNTPARSADCQTFNAIHGTTNNPWDLARTPGGSSGGAAAALAAGITALEIGSDIGGSLRVPASFCGVFAHKPTWGLVPLHGHWPPGSNPDVDLGVAGPLARSARDLSLLLSIICDGSHEPEPARRDVKGLKVALMLDEPRFALDAEVRLSIEAFASKLEAAGAVVEPVACPVDAEQLMFTYIMLLYPLMTADAGLAERALYEALRGPAKIARALGAEPLSWGPAILAASGRHRDWLLADGARRQMQQAVAGVFETYDVLLSPAAPVPAFKHTQGPLPFRKLTLSGGRKVAYTETLSWNSLATVCGLPATAMPAGFSASGLPIGAQLIGPKQSDFRLLSIAEAIEEIIGGFVAPPAIG